MNYRLCGGMLITRMQLKLKNGGGGSVQLPGALHTDGRSFAESCSANKCRRVINLSRFSSRISRAAASQATRRDGASAKLKHDEGEKL